MAEWIHDVLGEEFEQLTLELEDDDHGPVVATLVRALPAEQSWWERARRVRRPLDGVDVLYVHGWSDYFFQKRLARFWTARGARFHALDLRRYGRSLREGQIPGYIHDLAAYDEDIAAALTAMGRGADGASPRKLVLLGHSTGGLTLSLWAARHPDAVDALILNSPWLEFQFASVRSAIAPVVELTARIRPLEVAPQVDLGFYTRAQQEAADPDDPVEVDALWRPAQSMAVYAGWLSAILSGHAAVASGLSIPAPVLVLLSSRSSTPNKWTEDLTRTDSVLVVDDIARAALKLGPSVAIERIDGALHDVFLSRHEARQEAYRRLGRWVVAWRATW